VEAQKIYPQLSATEEVIGLRGDCRSRDAQFDVIPVNSALLDCQEFVKSLAVEQGHSGSAEAHSNPLTLAEEQEYFDSLRGHAACSAARCRCRHESKAMMENDPPLRRETPVAASF
jgi:hypothetical protein